MDDHEVEQCNQLEEPEVVQVGVEADDVEFEEVVAETDVVEFDDDFESCEGGTPEKAHAQPPAATTRVTPAGSIIICPSLPQSPFPFPN